MVDHGLLPEVGRWHSSVVAIVVYPSQRTPSVFGAGWRLGREAWGSSLREGWVVGGGRAGIKLEHQIWLALGGRQLERARAAGTSREHALCARSLPDFKLLCMRSCAAAGGPVGAPAYSRHPSSCAQWAGRRTSSRRTRSRPTGRPGRPPMAARAKVRHRRPGPAEARRGSNRYRPQLTRLARRSPTGVPVWSGRASKGPFVTSTGR